MGLTPEQMQYIQTVRALLRTKLRVELRPQNCFLNAMALTVGDYLNGQQRIQYWEGHVMPVKGSQELLGTARVPHAWVTIDGTLYDPTAEINRQTRNVAEDEYRPDAYDGKPVCLQKVQEVWDGRVTHPIDPALHKENQELIARQSEKAHQQSKPTDSACQPKQDGKAQ